VIDMDEKIAEIVMKVLIAIIKCLGDLLSAAGSLGLVVGMLGIMCGIQKGKRISTGGFIIAILGRVIMNATF
jgi:hypothetical protein